MKLLYWADTDMDAIAGTCTWACCMTASTLDDKEDDMNKYTVNSGSNKVKAAGAGVLGLAVASFATKAWGIMLGAGILGFSQVSYLDATALAAIHTFMLASVGSVSVQRG